MTKRIYKGFCTTKTMYKGFCIGVEPSFCFLNTCVIKCSFSILQQFFGDPLLFIQPTFFSYLVNSGREIDVAPHCDHWQPRVISKLFFPFYFRLALLCALSFLGQHTQAFPRTPFPLRPIQAHLGPFRHLLRLDSTQFTKNFFHLGHLGTFLVSPPNPLRFTYIDSLGFALRFVS